MAINGLILAAAGLVLYYVSRKLIRGEVGRKNNMGMGFKIKEAYASDEAWYRINREGGKLMIAPSLALIALGVLMALCGILFHISLLIFNIAIVVSLLVIALPLFGYWIWVRRNESKRKAA